MIHRVNINFTFTPWMYAALTTLASCCYQSAFYCYLSFASISLFAALTKHCRLCLKCNGTHTETRFCLSAKWTNPFKSAGTSVQLTTGSRGVCISSSNAGYTMFHAIVKGTGFSLHSPVSPSLPLPCITVCHHVSTGLVYLIIYQYGKS